jgi:hypothetical protein
MGDQVQRGEFLKDADGIRKDADGIRRAENGYGACQANISWCEQPLCPG